MPGTATNYDILSIPQGVIAQVWTGLAVPIAGARMTLHTDGTPESVANPDAVHLGYTDAGLTVTATETATDFFVDELAAPSGSSLDQLTVSISGTLTQVNDEEVMQVLGANFGTYGTAAGYKQMTLGFKTSISYTSSAIIYPSPMDSTKFAVFHLYSARNTAGFTFSLGRKVRAGTPFTLSGYGVSGRASADAVGNYWWQI
jgi:hypothetical protein